MLEFGGRGWREFLAGRPSAVAVTRRADGGAEVRDATVGAAGPVLVFTEAEWDAFQAGIAAGEFAPEVVPPELV